MSRLPDRPDLDQLRRQAREPHRAAGRLRAAKNVSNGPATVRIALNEPGDINEEVLGWLQRGYDENTAPLVPRRHAPG